MQSSPSSNSASVKTWQRVVTYAVRIIVGSVFIFSGFVKTIDPWGTLYKFEEYSAAMGLNILDTLLLTGVFALCAVEFLIGIFLIFGCYRKSTPIISLIFMCVMLPLTAWIAISNPVNDCGCFGDFLVISNWATFWKNVVLTALIIWLIRFNRFCTSIISPAFQWIAVVVSFAFVIAVGLRGYLSQPMLDFRPYPEGEQLVSTDNEESDEDFIFVYEKDGVRKEFGVNDELPSEEDGWKFVERKDIIPAKNELTSTRNDERTFRIWNREGDEDITDDVIDTTGKMIILLIPELAEVSPATTWKINSMHDWCENHGIGMIAVVSGTSELIKEWEDLSMPQYEIYTCDDTAIKEVARGNPAVVYIDGGTIKWKSTLGALDVDSLTSAHDSKAIALSAGGEKLRLLNMLYLYLICLAVPVTLSMLPRIKDAYTDHKRLRRVRSIRDDRARDAE